MNVTTKWLAGAALAIGICGALWWWFHRHAAENYIAHTNGRLEMARIDIAVKYPGRIVELPIHEGDQLEKDAIAAREDPAEVEAQIAGAEAARARAISAIARGRAEVKAHQTGESLAHLEWTQTQVMYTKRLVSNVELERRRMALEAETAQVAVAEAALDEARTTQAAADAEIARLKIVLAEETIYTPIAGRIEYRMIETGAVLPAGGRVATLLNSNDVYMTVFFDDATAGKIKVGDEARIVLDAFDGLVLPATVSFVSPEAQFSPKYVETQNEREKLVYRVKLQIPVSTARQYDGRLKAGATGEGYVRTNPTLGWPAYLSLSFDDRSRR